MENINNLTQPIFQLGQYQFSAGFLLGIMFFTVILMGLLFIWMGSRNAKHTMMAEILAEERARDAELRMAEILKSQAEMQGRMQTMAEVFGSRQSELNQSIRERLDGMTNRLGHTMNEQTRSTHENLVKLQERLAVIDNAQNNIQSLAGQVVQLQAILANKQSRGAYGQARMEAIIADALPQGLYEFQSTLSNASRPDCIIRMPNNAPSLVIDAKFPMEAWTAVREAKTTDTRKQAANQFRRDIETHIKDISDKYLIAGETQDTAFLFVPSESVFADIHEHFSSLIQKAHRARVVIVSPSLLMLSIQVIQSILKDSRMREQAHLIQAEVMRLMEDVTRLDERVRKLQTHFQQANKDIDDILISSTKISRRGEKIETLELNNTSTSPTQSPAQWHLRLVDDE